MDGGDSLKTLLPSYKYPTPSHVFTSFLVLVLVASFSRSSFKFQFLLQ